MSHSRTGLLLRSIPIIVLVLDRPHLSRSESGKPASCSSESRSSKILLDQYDFAIVEVECIRNSMNGGYNIIPRA